VGVQQSLGVSNARVARVVRRLQELPGQDLFKYADDDGELRSIGSADVNEYLRQISGQEFTAKDFRTWTATVLAAEALREMEQFDGAAQAKRNVVVAIEQYPKCRAHDAGPRRSGDSRGGPLHTSPLGTQKFESYLRSASSGVRVPVGSNSVGRDVGGSARTLLCWPI
jgi:hypothetical protein